MVRKVFFKWKGKGINIRRKESNIVYWFDKFCSEINLILELWWRKKEIYSNIIFIAYIRRVLIVCKYLGKLNKVFNIEDI